MVGLLVESCPRDGVRWERSVVIVAVSVVVVGDDGVGRERKREGKVNLNKGVARVEKKGESKMTKNVRTKVEESRKEKEKVDDYLKVRRKEGNVRVYKKNV